MTNLSVERYTQILVDMYYRFVWLSIAVRESHTILTTVYRFLIGRLEHIKSRHASGGKLSAGD